MKKTLVKFLSGFCLSILSILAFASCKEEKAVITFGLAFSEDVLEYVQPKVSYFDNDGSKIERVLTRDDFEVVTSESFGQSRNSYFWIVKIDYDHAGIENSCDITFQPIKQIAADKETFFYLAALMGNGSYSKTGFGDDIYYQDVDIDMSIGNTTEQFHKQFETAINSLISAGLHKTVRIDKNGQSHYD